MATSISKKIGRFAFWLVVSLLGLLVLVFLLIQLPFVQEQITREVEKVARNTLGTDVGIGRIDIRFPSYVAVDDVYLNNPEGDTIARLGHIGLGVGMYSLVRSTLDINELIVEDLYANVVTTDSSSNIQFLLDSLLAPADTTAPVADTTAGGGGFTIDLAGAELSIINVDIYYQDDPAGLLVDSEVRSLTGAIDDADVEALSFDIDYLQLTGADIALGVGESDAPVDTTAQAASMALTAGRVTIEESLFAMHMDSLDLATGLPYVNLEGGDLVVGDSIAFRGELFQLRDLSFRMDTPADSIPYPGAIDYNHLALSEVEAEATDIAYIVDSLHLRLRQLSGKERSGLHLQRTEGTVVYDPSYIGLENFLLRTSDSELRSENTAVAFDFTSDDFEELVARARVQGYLGFQDVARLVPSLAGENVIGNNLGKRLEFALEADGTVADMEIKRIALDGPGIELRASGRGHNLLDAEQVGGRLYLQTLNVTPGPLLPLLPAGTLPPDIDWPRRIAAEGEASYENERLTLDLYALENRVFGNGLNSRVRTSGVVVGPANFPDTRLDVRLDTLLATRATILAYVPPGTLPEDYTIPDFVRASGAVSGPMDMLDVNLRLSLPGDSTYARINGNLRNALDPDRLALDFEVSDLGININDVASILPDSLLPAGVNLPNVRIQGGRISGTPTDLTFDVPVQTDNGDWQLRGRYNPADLSIAADLNGVRIEEFFIGALRDSLAGLALGPLNIRAEVDGRLEPAMDLDINAFVAAEGGDSLLIAEAVVADNRYSADFAIMHPDMRVRGNGRYLIGADSVVFVEALVGIEYVQLQRWGLTPDPLSVEGSVVARSEGLDPYGLDAFVTLDDIILRNADGSSYIDSLRLNASMHDGDNEIFLRSDVIDGQVVGQFDPLKTPQNMVDYILGFWDESIDQPDPVEHGQQLEAALNLKRPQVLTGGLVPGLEQLSPLSFTLLYRDRSPELVAELTLEELVYAGLEAHGLHLEARGDTANFYAEADWDDINFNDQVDLGRTVVEARNENGELLTELQLYAENDSLRHYLGAYIDQGPDSLTVRLAPEQILNFERWSVPRNNLIALTGPNLIINNFALRNNGQALTASTSEPNDVEVRFDDFSLRTPSRLVFSEEEVAGGTLNGTVLLDDVMNELGIRGDLTVDSFAWTATTIGNIRAEVATVDGPAYAIDVSLQDNGNDVNIDGTYALSGALDMEVDINQLQLQSAEPFSLGYLQDTEGYLTGQIDLRGTATDPQMNGSVRFQDASLVISLLGERFRLGNDPITFNGGRIEFTNGLDILDSQGNDAVVTGDIRIDGFDNIALDMLVEAENFTVINSTEDENPDYYGFMSVDARVDIGGTATLPVIEVTATTNEGSDITYVYSAPSAGMVDAEGIVIFEESYQWADIIRRDTVFTPDDTLAIARTGLELTLDLDIQPNLQVRVIVDPVSGQEFVGRADGNLTLQINPDGSQEATGRIEVVEGTYDFIYQVINKQFQIEEGSAVVFNGDIANPYLDLTIRHEVRTSPLTLIKTFNENPNNVGMLRRKQTFYVIVELDGELNSSDLGFNVRYPENAQGNLGLQEIEDALGQLRQDDSRLTRNAFSLLAFGSFNIPVVEAGEGDGTSLANTTLNNALGGYLNNLANQYIGFVELDFGLDSYEDTDGSTNTNLRVSLRKTLFDDRVVISVDGVTGNDADEAAGTSQTYLDNITAEYLITEDGDFRLKFFNDRDRDILIGGNVLRYGGRITFSKNFDRLGWLSGGNEAQGK